MPHVYPEDLAENRREVFADALVTGDETALTLAGEFGDGELDTALAPGRESRIETSAHLDEHPLWPFLDEAERPNARHAARVREAAGDAAWLAYNLTAVEEGKPLALEGRRQLAREIFATKVRALAPTDGTNDGIIRIGPPNGTVAERIETLPEPWRALAKYSLAEIEAPFKTAETRWRTVHSREAAALAREHLAPGAPPAPGH